MRVPCPLTPYNHGLNPKRAAKIIQPDPPSAPGADEAESLDVWGFRDTHFDINENGHVIIRGSRYEELPASCHRCERSSV
jgi:hypothetical protein